MRLTMSVEGDLQHSLRIGDTVLLYANDAHGFIFSELTSSQHNSVAVTEQSAFQELEPANFSNVHNATFCVVVANKNKAQTKLTQWQKRIGNREPTKPEKELLHQAKKDVEAELKDNAAEQERRLGAVLVYGETVQLQHTLTKKFVAVNTTVTSRTENTSLRVELSAVNTSGCIFKILPIYKVHSVGDEVRFNDQVKFESMKTEGQFLHCSVQECGAVGFHVLENNFELNLSATESALTIIPHYRPQLSHDSKIFRAGQSVRLFHREYECYIAAEGSFAENPSFVEDVHCRKRKTDHGILKHPSTSSNTYWQIERESNQCSGEPLTWGERCRIRHMPTRLYLAVVTTGTGVGYKVTLKDCSFFSSASLKKSSLFSTGTLKEHSSFSLSHSASTQDLETVFALSPVIQEGSKILFESYAMIKHLATRTWLHLNKDQCYKRQAFDPNAPGLKGLKWDGAELYTLTASETKSYDDAFTLEMVAESLLDKFNFVAGIVPVLTTHLAQCSASDAPPLLPQAAFYVTSTLEDLASYISESANDRETKDRQKLLRNLYVLDMVISILRFFSPDAPDASQHCKVCKACYCVIESYLRGDSRKNENSLARFIDLFQTQVGMGLNAEKVMIEMVEDNTVIVSKMAASEIDTVVEKLVKTRDPRFLQFLSNLCVCNDKPIPSTQNTILDKLVRPHGKSVFFQLDVGGSELLPEGKDGVEVGVVYCLRPGSTRPKPLLNIARKGCAGEDFEFLKSQLLLLGKMCRGNNHQCIQALDESGLRWMTFQQALWCVRCPDLDPSIASLYAELIKVMYVDVGENRAVLENLSLSFVYSGIVEDPYKDSGGNDFEALTGVENKHFPDIRNWIWDHLTTVKKNGVIAEDEEENELLARVLEVLSLLVKYGYYDDPKDMEKVLEPLVEVMNGFTDRVSSASKKPGENTKVVEEDFSESGRFQEGKENEALFKVKERAIEVLELIFNFRFYVRLQRFIFDFRQLYDPPPGHAPSSTTEQTRPPMLLHLLMEDSGRNPAQNTVLINTARDRLKTLFSKSAFFFEKTNYIDSAATPFHEILLDMSRYESDELVQGSLHLLNRCYSSEISLFESALQTQLLLTDESQKVFLEIDRTLPVLRRLLSTELDNKGRERVVEILHTFTIMCQLPATDGEPHTQNQKILYNFRVLSAILNFVLEPPRREDTLVPGAEGIVIDEVVYEKCFLFLKVFSRNNLEVQRRIYERMNELLHIEVAVPCMAEVLTEVFTGGHEMALHVKEEQIERIFQLISRGEAGTRIGLMQTLQSMVKVEDLDLPIKRNQAFIIKYFSKTQDKLCNHLLGDKNKKKRWLLLHEAPDGDPDLQLLQTVTDLLASCAEGENLFIESVCQTIYKIEELLQITCHPELSAERKRPFARFLTWVYLNTEANKHQSGASSLSCDRDMWRYLEYLSVLLENIGIALWAVPDSQNQWVYRRLTIRDRTSSTSKLTKRKAIRTTLRRIEYVTTDSGELKPGVLLYFVDSVLPLLQSFFANLYSLPDEGKGGRDMQLRVTNTLLSSLMQLCGVLMKYLTTEMQVQLYRRTVAALLHSLTPDLVTVEVKQMIGHFHEMTEGSKGAVTTTRKLYEAEYCDEIRLNENFKRFVANYRLAYEGPNTVSTQIGVKYSKDATYSEFADEDCSVYLPLGPSFQEHVALFVCRRERTLGRVLAGGHGGRGSREEELLRPETERLVKQLEISFNKLKDLDDMERRQQDELDLKTLWILCAIVRNRFAYIDPDLQEDDPAGYRCHCMEKLHPVQNKLQGFENIVSRVVPLLSHPNDEIVCKILAFLKAMLYSGNPTVQQGFQHLLDTREERLFTTLSNLLQHAAITYNEKRALHAQSLSRKATEEAQWGSLCGNRKKREDDMEELKVSTAVTVEFPDVEDGETKGEHVPLRLIGKEEKKDKAKGEQVAEEEKALTFNDSTQTYTKLTLEVLGLMCDNQYRLMQNYLREQKDNLHTIDLVGEVAHFAQHFYTDISHETMELLHLILQTLIELCVGNYLNQKVIYNRQIMDVLNAVLQHDIRDCVKQTDDHIQNAVGLKGSAVELVEVMIEKTNPCNQDLAKEIAGSLDLGALHSTLEEFYELKDAPRLKQLQVDDDAERGLFRAYHILVTLQDYGNDLGNWKVPPEEDKDVEVSKAIEYCRPHSRSIEINYKNMDDEVMVTKVNFQFDPSNDLRNEVIEKVKWHINRDSAEDKLRDLLKWMSAIKADTVHQNWLQQHWITRILIIFPTQRYYLLLFLTFLLNLFVLISFSVPEDHRNDATNASWPDAANAIEPDVQWYFRSYLLFILGAFHLLFSVWMVVEYFLVNLRNFIFPLPASFYKFTKRWGWNGPKKTYSTINIYGVRTVYTVVFLLASILSLVFYGHLYSLCLLYIIINNDVLLRVLSAVTKHGVSLLWVAVLGGIILYIYAVISFAFLHESFHDKGENPLYCNTLGHCFITVIRWGLIDNLGQVIPLVPQQFETAGLRILFDVSFFIIITTIGLNIVFGIIVDTFSELRNERFHAEQDKKSFCFICNLPKHDLERRGKGFDHHVKREHNMWAYIYYSIYLDSMDTNDHNAVQKYVYEMIREKRIKFFPLLQALCLEAEEDETAQQLKELRTMVTSVLERFKEEEHEKSLESKRQEQEQWEKDVMGAALPFPS